MHHHLYLTPVLAHSLTCFCAFTQMARKEIAPGIGRLSRSQVYARRQLYKGRKTGTTAAKPEAAPTKEVQVKGSKNGGTRLVPTSKAPRFYPAEDVRKPKQSRKAVKPTKLRDSISPGTVLILLAGRFRGKRVVFLKQLQSGLLLVTGPYKVNGVPLRRVNQAYVIATSTKIDLGGYKVRSRSHFCSRTTCSGWPLQADAKLNDSYFSKSEKKRTRSAEEEFFEDGKAKAKEAFPESKVADQREVDKVVLAAVKKTEYLSKYLKASWGLSKGEYPHQLVF